MPRCLIEGLAGRLSGWWLDSLLQGLADVVDLLVLPEEGDDVHRPPALDSNLDGKIAG